MKEKEEKEEGGRGRKGREEAGWLVRWQVCLSGLPWHGEGLLHLSEHSSGPEHRDRLPQTPLGYRITLLKGLLSLLKYHGSK